MINFNSLLCNIKFNKNIRISKPVNNCARFFRRFFFLRNIRINRNVNRLLCHKTHGCPALQPENRSVAAAHLTFKNTGIAAFGRFIVNRFYGILVFRQDKFKNRPLMQFRIKLFPGKTNHFKEFFIAVNQICIQIFVN